MSLTALGFLRVASVLLVASLVVACHDDSSSRERTGATTGVAPTDAGSTPPALSAPPVASGATKHVPSPDADIASAIERHFLDERLLRAEHVKAVVTQGVAALSGSVSNLLAKERAVAVAETIRGVRSVVDEVTVAPVARPDTQLESDVTSALKHDKATQRYTIGVAAKSGTVTLSGTADSWQETNVIGDVAKTVPGLRSLVNAMTVTYATVRPESEIATDVRRRISNDAWLDGDTITVEVRRHDPTSAFPQAAMVVHLVGTVGSVAQKSRARSDSWVAGVDRVDDNDVNVDWFAQNDQRRVTDPRVKSDAEIAQALRDAFGVDPRLKTSAPQVAVQNGEAVLSGAVDGPQARRASDADATDTIGVWRVRDEVVVQGAGRPSDGDLDRAIKSVLADALPSPEGKAIQVSSSNGRVTLKGAIPSGAERLDAVAEVRSVPGVSDVEDDLAVTGLPADLKASIEERLFWDPRVERELVSVAVGPDGVATLTGTMDGWSQIKAAGDDALRGGASRVLNMLKLKKHPEVVAPGQAGTNSRP